LRFRFRFVVFLRRCDFDGGGRGGCGDGDGVGWGCDGVWARSRRSVVVGDVMSGGRERWSSIVVAVERDRRKREVVVDVVVVVAVAEDMTIVDTEDEMSGIAPGYIALVVEKEAADIRLATAVAQRCCTAAAVLLACALSWAGGSRGCRSILVMPLFFVFVCVFFVLESV